MPIGVGHGQVINADTTSRTIKVEDNGSVIWNTGAGSLVVWTLPNPADAKGMTATFVNNAATGGKILATGGARLKGPSGLITAANGFLLGIALGAAVSIACDGTDWWVMPGVMGEWAVDGGAAIGLAFSKRGPGIITTGEWQAWWKADGFGIANNDAVKSWFDSSGCGNHLIPVSTSPLWKTAVQNSLPGVDFNGTADAMKVPFDNSNLFVKCERFVQPFTVFMVCKQDSATGTQCVFDSAYGAVTLYIASGSASITAGGSTLSAAITGTNPNIIEAVYNGASSFVQVNGGTKATGNAGANALDGQMWLGSFSYVGSPFNGPIFDAAFALGSVSDAERSLIRVAAGAKYNFAVTA